jgi:hypothetical protein
VINLQNREPHQYCTREVTLLSTIGAFVGAEIEMARLEVENAQDVTEPEGGRPLLQGQERPWCSSLSRGMHCSANCARPLAYEVPAERDGSIRLQ